MISTRCKYAIWALAHMTRCPNKTHKAKEISEATGLPHHFLSQILRELSKENILYSIKGKGGGFRLERPPEEQSLYDLRKIFRQDSDNMYCLFCLKQCRSRACCPLADLSDSFLRPFECSLKNITLKDLADAINGKKSK